MTAEPVPSDDWTEPGVWRVADGVHRIPLPLPNDGLRAVNVYAIEDGDGLVFVDSGWSIPEARRLLESAVAALGCSLGDVRRYLVTHVHRDHYTMAIGLRREHGTPVALGAGERPSLEAVQRPARRPLAPQLDLLRSLGAGAIASRMEALLPASPDGDRSEWESPDEWISPGPLTLGSGRVLEVVETPGHTRGHVVFSERDAGLLFAGDHVLPSITPSIGFEPVMSANPLGDFLSSLAKVRAMPDAKLLPAHGPVAASVHARVDELVAHHGRRLDETEAAVAAGAANAFEVAGRLGWTRRARQLGELDLFNQMLAVAETGAHLDLLAAQGRLRRVDSGGVRCYTPAQ